MLFMTPGLRSALHRVHTEWQPPLSCEHSIIMEKLAQAGEGGGLHAHPLSLQSPSRTKLQCMLQLGGQIHTLTLFHLYQYMYSVVGALYLLFGGYRYSCENIANLSSVAMSSLPRSVILWSPMPSP